MDLEAACRPDCILASNTSTIDISLIGQKTSAQDRIVGAHFFSPAHIMPLLEIVRTDRTSSQVSSRRMPSPMHSVPTWSSLQPPPPCCTFQSGIDSTIGPPSQVLLDTLTFGTTIRKIPVVVGNCTGFAVNRAMFPYQMAALMLLDLGIDPYKIDKAVKSDFGMPMGPFSLVDLVGADIRWAVGHVCFGWNCRRMERY